MKATAGSCGFWYFKAKVKMLEGGLPEILINPVRPQDVFVSDLTILWRKK